MLMSDLEIVLVGIIAACSLLLAVIGVEWGAGIFYYFEKYPLLTKRGRTAVLVSLFCLLAWGLVWFLACTAYSITYYLQ